jgi:hypothetical protein
MPNGPAADGHIGQTSSVGFDSPIGKTPIDEQEHGVWISLHDDGLLQVLCPKGTPGRSTNSVNQFTSAE